MIVAAPTWHQVRARVAYHGDAGGGHLWLDLDVPEDFVAPAPGQFVQLLLAHSRSAALLPRPMSVAAATRKASGLRLGFLYVPVGLGTQALSKLGPGAEVEVLGPLGRGYPLVCDGTPVLVAGGRGVAPLLFAADELARHGQRCEFILGARSKRYLVGVEDAKLRLERRGGRLHLCTDDGSRGFRGNVVALLERLAPRFPQPLVIHACGPHGMLKAVARWTTRRRTTAFVAMESIMACGTGVCRGCPLPRSESGRRAFGNRAPSLLGNRDFAMCCTEGPVFEAGELDWDQID